MYETSRLVRVLRDEGSSVESREMAAIRLRQIIARHWNKVMRAVRYYESMTSAFTSHPCARELEQKRAALDARSATAVLVDYEILGL